MGKRKTVAHEKNMHASKSNNSRWARKNCYKCFSILFLTFISCHSDCIGEAFSERRRRSRHTKMHSTKIIICRATILSKRVWNLHLNLVIVKFSIPSTFSSHFAGVWVWRSIRCCVTRKSLSPARNTWQFAICLKDRRAKQRNIFRKWLFHVAHEGEREKGERISETT